MNAKASKPANENSSEAPFWRDTSNPAPTFTARERLRHNILRLQSLEQELLSGQSQQYELLTAIELVGFKVRHLAQQIQKAEQLSSATVSAAVAVV